MNAPAEAVVLGLRLLLMISWYAWMKFCWVIWPDLTFCSIWSTTFIRVPDISLTPSASLAKASGSRYHLPLTLTSGMVAPRLAIATWALPPLAVICTLSQSTLPSGAIWDIW